MSRRNVGLSSLARGDALSAGYSSLSTSLGEAQVDVLSAQLATFKAAVQAFATKHRSTIVSDPVFRAHFADMCAELGVDPLGGGRKGLWDFVALSDWTYALALQVVDVCLRHRDVAGGLVHVDQVLEGVARLRGNNAITRADLARAIRALEPLGAGYAFLAKGTLVRCMPAELDTDALNVLEVAADLGRAHLGLPELQSARPAWPLDRVQRALEKAVDGGLVWTDDLTPSGQQEFWAPSLVHLDD